MTTDTSVPEARELGPDIYADLEAVRARGSVVRVRLTDGHLAWMVTSHAAITEIGRNPHITRDGGAHWGDLLAGKVAPMSLLAAWVTNAGPLSRHGAEHARFRDLMRPPFAPRRVKAMVPMIQEVTAGVLEEIALSNPADARKEFAFYGFEPTDLRKDFCFPVPIRVMGVLLGLDVDDEQGPFQVIKTGADAVFDTSLDEEGLMERFGPMLVVIAQLVADKRAHPDDGVISSLIQYADQAGGFTDDEIAEAVRILIVAGYETTVNALDQAIFLALTHPQVLSDLLTHAPGTDAARTAWLGFIHEVMRYASPAANVPLRFAAQRDVVVDGRLIRAGEAILASYAGAGRDPAVFDHADVFDPARANNRKHLGFGTGPHRCLGEALALEELLVALPMLFGQFRLALAEDPDRIPPSDGWIMHGHQRLLATLELGA